MDRSLKTELKARCFGWGIPLMGVASAERWHNPPFQPWMPQEFYPDSILPETSSVIVLGLPITLPILETSPSIHYHELYKTVNSLLDQNGYIVSNLLNERGFPSVWIPRDGYGSLEVLKKNPMAFFSHRHAAYLAGLGTFGVNNMLLTREFGPRVRLVSVFTSAKLPPDPIIEDDLCTKCMRCVRSCPSGALQEGDYPSSITQKDLCTGWSDGLRARYISPCGICIKVCPVGDDRSQFGREDADIYSREGHELARAWDHTRSYGGL